MADHRLWFCCFVLTWLPVVYSIYTYEMADQRDKIFNMALELLHQGRLTLNLTSNRKVGSFETSIKVCRTGDLRSETGRLMFYFEKNQLPCERGHLSFIDGPSEGDQTIEGLDRVCDAMPGEVSVTTGHYLTIKYTELENGAGSVSMSLIFTSFREGACMNGEFKCTNNRCIDSSLKCNEFNSCGDDSSCSASRQELNKNEGEMQVSEQTNTTAIIVGCVVAAVFVGSFIAICLCCFNCGRNRGDRHHSRMVAMPGISLVTHPAMTRGHFPSNTESQHDLFHPPPPYKESDSHGFILRHKQELPVEPGQKIPTAPPSA